MSEQDGVFSMGQPPAAADKVCEQLAAINISLQNLNQTLQTLIAMAKAEVGQDEPRRVGS